MNRYRTYGPTDDAPNSDGDVKLVGVDGREPGVVAPGLFAYARNVRFRDGAAKTRRGIVKIQWGAACEARDPNQPWEPDEGGGAGTTGDVPEGNGTDGDGSVDPGNPNPPPAGGGGAPAQDYWRRDTAEVTPPQGMTALVVTPEYFVGPSLAAYLTEYDGDPTQAHLEAALDAYLADYAAPYTRQNCDDFAYRLLTNAVAAEKASLEAGGYTVQTWDGKWGWGMAWESAPPGPLAKQFLTKLSSGCDDPTSTIGDYLMVTASAAVPFTYLFVIPP